MLLNCNLSDFKRLGFAAGNAVNWCVLRELAVFVLVGINSNGRVEVMVM